MIDRQTILLGVLVTSLLALVTWLAAVTLPAARADAVAATASLAESRAFADSIARRTPAEAVAEAGDASPIGRIEEAAATADLPPGTVARVGGEQSRQLDDGISEQSRRLFLRGVTLEKLVVFLQALAREESGTRVSAIELRAPRSGGEAGPGEERWDADVAVTRVVRDIAGAPASR